MAGKLINIKILTPDKMVYNQTDISEITIPTTSGEITVLPNHVPLVSVIKTGEIRLKREGVKIAMAISGGILEVRHGSEVIILAERGELAYDIDLARAEEAYKRAKQAMSGKIEDMGEELHEKNLEKEMNRISVAKKWR